MGSLSPKTSPNTHSSVGDCAADGDWCWAHLRCSVVLGMLDVCCRSMLLAVLKLSIGLQSRYFRKNGSFGQLSDPRDTIAIGAKRHHYTPLPTMVGL